MHKRRQVLSELTRLAKIYKDYRDCSLNEMETCEYLVNGLLHVLGWDPADPSIGRREHPIKTSSASDIYADYSFFDRKYRPDERAVAHVRLFVEAKRVSCPLGVDVQGRCQNKQTEKWLEQVAFYGILKGARWLVLTNGHQLALFRPSQDGDSLYAQGRLVFQSFDEMLSHVDDLMLLSRENVWSENLDQALEKQCAVQYQIPTPRTRVRAMFEANDLHVFFDDKIVDFAYAEHQIPVAPDPLFYQGVNASWHNILANQDVIRQNLIEQMFHAYYFHSNICIIRSESGQGKTTLMFRFAYEYRDLFYVLELRQLTASDVRFCELGMRDLAGLRKPILVLIDDVTRRQGWSNFVRAVADMHHVYLLATTREDEWAQIDVRGIESRIAYVSPKLEYDTARLVFDGITRKGLRKTAASPWEAFLQSKGRLLEFVTLITQGKHLEAVLDGQVSSLAAQDIRFLTVLRFVSFFHALGLSTDIGMLETAVADMSKLELLHVLDQLGGEFVSKVADGVYEGLHELRSRIITDILHRRFFAFGDSLSLLLDYARIDQFETLIKNLPLLGESIWERSGIERLFSRLQTIEDPVALTRYIRAFGKSAQQILSDQISDLTQAVAKKLIRLDPESFVLALHRAFGSSLRWKPLARLASPDRMIFEQIPNDVLTSYLAQALPVTELDGRKEWTDYAQLVEWAEVVGITRIAKGCDVPKSIVQSVGEFEFTSFASEQTDVLGLLTLLEIFGESLQPHAIGEIVATWCNLDWDCDIGALDWEEQKRTVERLVELETAPWLVARLDTDWRDLLLDPLAAGMVGWDPPDATLDFLDEIKALDEQLAERLKEYPPVGSELERIADWRAEQQENEQALQDPERRDIQELVVLPPEEIANRLTSIPSSVAVRLLGALEAKLPDKLHRTIVAIGADELASMGKALRDLEDIEDFVSAISKWGNRSTFSDVCQAMKIYDSDLILERATQRHESEGRRR